MAYRLWRKDARQFRPQGERTSMPRECRHELMMPHVTGSALTGTGLGLKIAIDLMCWHGGEIRLDRSDELGTRFLIKLPTEPPNKTDEAPL